MPTHTVGQVSKLQGHRNLTIASIGKLKKQGQHHVIKTIAWRPALTNRCQFDDKFQSFAIGNNLNFAEISRTDSLPM
jgi:hypothetical protein